MFYILLWHFILYYISILLLNKGEKMHSNNYQKNLSTMIFVSTFGGLLFGYDTGVVNGALPFMSTSDQLNLDAFHQVLVVSILQLVLLLAQLV